jgi:hemerythrin-like domain-containing protein
MLEEHKIIDEMLDLLDLSIQKTKEPPGLSEGIMAKELDFCKNFVNKCHEGKEEEILAPELHMHGYPVDRGPILDMFEDHKKGRAILRRLLATEKTVRTEDRQQSFAQMAAAYTLFLYEHMRDEEDHLYERADLAIEAPRQVELEANCRKFDEAKLGKDSKQRYLKLIEEIRSALD